jgi:hypothetical protein
MPGMSRLRLALAALLLIWPPLTGALAEAAGVSLAHHHCDNAWHGHDHDGHDGDSHGHSAVNDAECPGALNLDPATCDDCGIVAVALLPLTFDLAPGLGFAFGASRAPASRPHAAHTRFRPPIA